MKNTGTIFDLYEDQMPEGQQGYMELAAQAPTPTDDSFFDSVKDYGKTALKGAIEGVSYLGTIMGPLQNGKSREEQLEEQTQALDELLPTKQSYGKNIVRAGLKELPAAVASPFGAAVSGGVRALASGASGETAKELGAPEWLQTVSKVIPYIAPSQLGKLFEKGKFKEIIQMGRRHGLSDEKLAPLIQSDFKQKWLSGLAQKTGKTQSTLSNTKRSLDAAYESMAQSPSAKESLSPNVSAKLFSDLSQLANKVPSEVKNRLAEDMLKLTQGPVTGKKIFDLWRNLNYYYSKGVQHAGLFKEPLKDAISTFSPELAKDFDSINKLYSKFYPLASKLKPQQADQIIRAGEVLGLFGGVTTGMATFNWPMVTTTVGAYLGEKSARKLLSNLLTNPKYQQLSLKMVEAIKSNKFALAKNVIDEFNHLVRDIDPDSEGLKELTEDEWESIFSQKSSQTEKGKEKPLQMQ